MKRVLISMLVVAVLAAGVCIFAVCIVDSVCDEMERMRTEAFDLAQRGEMEAALGQLNKMQRYWREQEAALTVVLAHSTMMEVTSVLIESRADLLEGEADEFEGDMMILDELLRQLCADERLKLSNILYVC